MRLWRSVWCLVLVTGMCCAESTFTVSVTSAGGDRAADAPRIYIYHTHTLEAYTPTASASYAPTETWRTLDAGHNVLRVGEELASRLEKAGFLVYHDRTDYERPDLSVAYARALEGLEKTLDDPYDLYIDIHRDAYSEGNGKNTVEAEGLAYARVLFLVGKGSGQTGVDEKPDWQQNSNIAKRLSDSMNDLVPDISRGISYKSGRYNQHIATGCLLVEAGNNRNTLEEALNTMGPLCMAVCRYFDALD